LSKRTDFCVKCCELKVKINNTRDAEEKQNHDKELKAHLNEAAAARETYNRDKIATTIQEGKIVLSFDFSESMLIPILRDTPSTF